MRFARSISLFALALVLVFGCSQSGDEIRLDEGDASVDSSPVEESSLDVATSPEARAVVARLESALEASTKPSASTSSPQLPKALLKPASLSPIELTREGVWLRVRVQSEPRNYRAEVALPVFANDAFRIADLQTKLSAEVALRGASDVPAEIVGEQVVYRGAASRGDVVHRPSALGTEDFILFDEAPPGEKLAYDVTLDERVAGLRLVENTLELLDEGGAPRLRVAPPYVIDAEGERHHATLSIDGCAFDTNPAAPWGRMPTAPGASLCTVEVAWGDRDIRYPAIVDPSWTTTGSMRNYRYHHSAVLLSTGKVLVMGGGLYGAYLSNAELFDPATETWTATGSMTVARYEHTATRLGSGKVLVTGGYNSTSSYLSSATIFDPATGTWSPTANDMGFARSRHSATLLQDGSVLVVGGSNAIAPINAAEIYSPITNSFSPVGSMSATRQDARAVALPNGKVLVTGGQGINSSYWNTAELYDPSTESFSLTPAFTGARARHTATLLATGKVLIFGGYNGSSRLGSAALYHPETNTWSASVEQNFAQDLHTGTLLSDGRVLLAGGVSNTDYVNRAVIYDPSTNATAATVVMATPRAYHTATLLPSGSVLVAGGYNGGPLVSSELFTVSQECTQASECMSGFCVDGYCCNTACDSPCARCNRTGLEGLCQSKPFGELGNPSCSPYLCGGSSINCPVSCTASGQCADGNFCNANRCVPKLATGAACTSAAQCQSGFCNDGYCCDQGCGGACDVCAAAFGASSNGICTNLPAGTTCNTRYLCTGASGACPSSCNADTDCFETAYCNANKQCVPKLANGNTCSTGNQCSSTHCVDGHCCNNECEGDCNRCDVSGLRGVCAVVSVGNVGTPSCSPYVCNGTSVGCPSSCTSDSHCASGYFCDGDSCIPDRANGESCNGANQCQSGFCADGFCCDKACGGACEQCADSLGGSANGICTSLASGTPNCGNYVCTGASGTCPSTCASDASCADGRYCNASKVCAIKLAQGSSCSANNQCASGNCVDGACCNTACSGGCDRCDLAASRGVCTVIAAGAIGASPSCGQYTCNGTSPSCPTTCTSDANCVSTAVCVSGACVPKAPLGASCDNGKLCLSGHCADGVCCNTACGGGSCDSCNLPGSIGTCKVAPLGSEGSPGLCSPYLCNGASVTCPSSCTGNANCIAGYACIGGSCQPRKADGASCIVANDCESGICADGVCCDAACTGGCERCDLAGSKGVCTLSEAKTPGNGCGLYLCDGASSSCPTECIGNDACDDGHCYVGKCYPKAGNGSSCSTSAECQSGFCVDGTCCESSCDGQCARCDEPASLGTCQAVTGDPVGQRPACASDGSSCGGSCDGVDMTACSYPNTETICASGSCVDGVMTHEARCDGQGACNEESEACAPYACSGAVCMTACSGNDDCTASADCVEGECKGTLDPGAACVASGECQSGFCVDGVCCQSACTDACMACNVEGSVGSCVADTSEEGCAGVGEETSFELSESDSGCGCRVAGERREGSAGLALGGVAMGLVLLRRRRA